MKKYKNIFFFIVVLLAMQLIHLAIFGLLFYLNIGSYTLENNILIYSFPLISFLGIIYLIKYLDIDFKFNFQPPVLKTLLFSLALLCFVFILQNVFEPLFLKNIFEKKLLFLDFNFSFYEKLKSNFHIIILSIFFGPFLEEILYRRIIFKKLSESFNLNFSVITTSILFSLMHSSLDGFFVYLFVGIILTYLYHLTKNLMLNVLFHLIFNLLTHLTVFKTYNFTDDFFLLGLCIYGICAFGIVIVFKQIKLITKTHSQ